jgi:hypothetical protein
LDILKQHFLEYPGRLRNKQGSVECSELQLDTGISPADEKIN